MSEHYLPLVELFFCFSILIGPISETTAFSEQLYSEKPLSPSAREFGLKVPETSSQKNLIFPSRGQDEQTAKTPNVVGSEEVQQAVEIVSEGVGISSRRDQGI